MSNFEKMPKKSGKPYELKRVDPKRSKQRK